MTESNPEIRAELPQPDGSLLLRLWVPASLPLFAGHFPGFPILPGVAQVHWAARLGMERFSIEGDFSRILNLKFQKLIPPESELDLHLSWDPEHRRMGFAFISALGQHASGKIEFADKAP